MQGYAGYEAPGTGTDSIAVGLGVLVRLPFELSTCLAAELLALLTLKVDSGVEPLRPPKTSPANLQDEDHPWGTLYLSCQPFLPTFQRSICEGIRSCRDGLWDTYESQAKDVHRVVSETNWPKVAKELARWLYELLQLLTKERIRWFLAQVAFVAWRIVASVYGFVGRHLVRRIRARLGSQSAVLESQLESVLAESRKECDEGKAQFSAGELDAALSHYAKAQEMLSQVDVKGKVSACMEAELKSEQVRVYVNIAVCHKKSGRLIAAADTATEALALEPEHVKALFLRGGARLASRSPTEAVQDLMLAVSLDPENASARAELKRALAYKRAEASDKHGCLSRAQVVEMLAEMARRQSEVQQKISALAREMVKDQSKPGDSAGPPGPVVLGFLDAHARVMACGLPKDAMQDYGFDDEALQEILLEFEDDAEVISCAQQLVHVPDRGDSARAGLIKIKTIVEIHKCMMEVMREVLGDFQKLPEDQQLAFSRKEREASAELIVTLAVESQFDVLCEDVELAVIQQEEKLQGSPEFLQCNEEISGMMRALAGSAETT